MNENECWRAVNRRDPRYDGRFVYGVRTTGIFCRPSCPARRARRENVRFYPSPEAALREGLRACRRCRPAEARAGDPRTARMAALARFIEEHADEELSLADLAAQAEMSPFHLQRTFRRVLGVTPKELQTAARFERLKAALRSKAPVLDAVFDAGFGSTSRVYERSEERLGMTPSAYRAGWRGEHIAHAARKTALGWFLVAATPRGICFAQFGDSPDALHRALSREFPNADLRPSAAIDHPALEAWMTGLETHLRGEGPSPELPLDLRGTAFQVRVWRYLTGLKPGEVTSYGEIARALGAPRAARAVAGACAANRIAVLVPCHRVLRGDGALGGYRWGEARKRRLLRQERARGA